MSMSRELTGMIINSQRNIDDQIAKLRGYLSEIETTMSTVSEVLGADDDYGKKMNDQLAQSKKTVEDAIGTLANAKEKLSQVGLVGRR